MLFTKKIYWNVTLSFGGESIGKNETKLSWWPFTSQDMYWLSCILIFRKLIQPDTSLLVEFYVEVGWVGDYA